MLGPPKNKERTRVEETFRHFFGFGRLWSSPGAQNGPKTSPKPSQDPSKPRLLAILNQFSDDFDRFFKFVRLIFVCIFACVWVVVLGCTKKSINKSSQNVFKLSTFGNATGACPLHAAGVRMT